LGHLVVQYNLYMVLPDYTIIYVRTKQGSNTPAQQPATPSSPLSRSQFL